MNEKFKYRCSPRSRPVDRCLAPKIDAPLTGGSGGGSIPAGPEQGGNTSYHDGTYTLAANALALVSRPPLPPAIPGEYLISIFAPGLAADGRVEVNASQGVRVTAGPPMMPSASSEGTNGVEVIVGETQEITIQRGLIPDVDQQILMTPGAILVDGGVGTVTIQSMTEVKLQVAEGLSSITLTPAGIIIQGLLVSIN